MGAGVQGAAVGGPQHTANGREEGGPAACVLAPPLKLWGNFSPQSSADFSDGSPGILSLALLPSQLTALLIKKGNMAQLWAAGGVRPSAW